MGTVQALRDHEHAAARRGRDGLPRHPRPPGVPRHAPGVRLDAARAAGRVRQRGRHGNPGAAQLSSPGRHAAADTAVHPGGQGSAHRVCADRPSRMRRKPPLTGKRENPRITCPTQSRCSAAVFPARSWTSAGTTVMENVPKPDGGGTSFHPGRDGMPGQFPVPDTFESGRCAGCGVLLDDAGIIWPGPPTPGCAGPAGHGSRRAAASAPCRCPTGGWPQKVRITWTAGLASLASIVLGGVLAAHGEALNKVSNQSGGFWAA